MYKRILVPVDGSAASMSSLSEAIKMRTQSSWERTDDAASTGLSLGVMLKLSCAPRSFPSCWYAPASEAAEKQREKRGFYGNRFTARHNSRARG